MNKSFEKMFEILGLYTMDRTSLSISEIQKEIGFPKSTIFRILNTMEFYNYIEQNAENHRYSLGFNFFRLGSIYQGQLDFRSTSLPVMKKIAKETNETVELNIIDDISRICIEKVDSSLDVRNFVRVGDRKPVHVGASGKVLLSFLSPIELEKTIEKLKNVEQIGTEKLELDIKKIKLRGYEVTKGERVPGSFAIASPIFDNKGVMIASLTIAGPIQRLTNEREEQLVKILMDGAKGICEKLGYFDFPYN
ncbi:IclR family transcriptional regulator [Sporosarcina sp. E16_3]|uniref:IclR family transcriptional regulator n=1 Tax=Sporosarcina sp. E16_3 TaxID=2789293 RepID=UPI001A91A254|nr:IclR family transcriptional regulator [Sporosarcina sp. E16_3]MBO0603008.1 IclR family transcriptional regulator [Sporosarcina sp. E16_3]